MTTTIGLRDLNGNHIGRTITVLKRDGSRHHGTLTGFTLTMSRADRPQTIDEGYTSPIDGNTFVKTGSHTEHHYYPKAGDCTLTLNRTTIHAGDGDDITITGEDDDK